MTSIDDEKAKRTTTARTDCFVCLARWVVVRSVDHPCSSCVERKKQRARMVITYLCRCGRCALTRRRARRRTDVLLIFARRLVGGTLGYRRSSFRRCARRRRSVFSSVSFPLCFRACTHRFAPARLFVPFVRLSGRALFHISRIHIKSDDRKRDRSISGMEMNGCHRDCDSSPFA